MRLRSGLILGGLTLIAACSGAGGDGSVPIPMAQTGAGMGGMGLPIAGGSAAAGASTAGKGGTSSIGSGGVTGSAGSAGAGVGGDVSPAGNGGASGMGGSSEMGGVAGTGGSAEMAGAAGKAGSGGAGGSGGKGNSGGDGAGGKAGSGGMSSGGMGGSGNGGIKLPPANAGFDYQIGGAYTPPQGVTVVSRDRGDAPAPGIYNICYVNGFQAQQSDDNWWLTQHPDLILRDDQNNPVVDPDWNEMLLDTSTAQKRQALADIVGGWIKGCAADGFDAVEVDNLDSYSRSGGRLTQANNVAFMGLISAVGHQAGLAMGQKNSTELVGSKAQMGTDFAVAEECNRYSECGSYTAGYGDLVFIIEYRDQDFTAGCQNYPQLSIVRRDVNVSTPGSAGYVYKGC